MLVLIRHAETEHDAEKRFQGQLNSFLTQLGNVQSGELGKSMEDQIIDAVYFPDSEPYWATSFGIGTYHPKVPFIREDALKGRSGGEYEGKLYSVLKKELPPKKYKLWERDYFEAPLMGESYYDVSFRVIPFFKEKIIPQINDNKMIVLISDDAVVKILIGYIKNAGVVEIPSFKVEPAMSYEFRGKLS